MMRGPDIETPASCDSQQIDQRAPAKADDAGSKLTPVDGQGGSGGGEQFRQSSPSLCGHSKWAQTEEDLTCAACQCSGCAQRGSSPSMGPQLTASTTTAAAVDNHKRPLSRGKTRLLLQLGSLRRHRENKVESALDDAGERAQVEIADASLIRPTDGRADCRKSTELGANRTSNIGQVTTTAAAAATTTTTKTKTSERPTQITHQLAGVKVDACDLHGRTAAVSTSLINEANETRPGLTDEVLNEFKASEGTPSGCKSSRGDIKSLFNGGRFVSSTRWLIGSVGAERKPIYCSKLFGLLSSSSRTQSCADKLDSPDVNVYSYNRSCIGHPIGSDQYRRGASGQDDVQTICVGPVESGSIGQLAEAERLLTNVADGGKAKLKDRRCSVSLEIGTRSATSEIGANMSSRQQLEREVSMTSVCNRTPSLQQIRQKHFSSKRSSERRSTLCSSSGAMTATDINCDSSTSSGGLNCCPEFILNEHNNHLRHQQPQQLAPPIEQSQANCNATMSTRAGECMPNSTSSSSIDRAHARNQRATATAVPNVAAGEKCRITLVGADKATKLHASPKHVHTTTKPLKQRDVWGKNIEFLLAVIGFAVDLGNIWRFPYICYKNGGGAFLIPYTIMFVLGGLPIFYLEMSLGQYFSSGCLTVWRRVCPMAKGIGYAMCVLNFFTGLYYNTIISWAVFFFVESFTFGSLPWTSCTNMWNVERCRTIEQRKEMLHAENYTGLTNISSPTQDYFEREVLQIQHSEGIEHIGSIRAPLAVYLAIVFVCVYFAIWKGVKSTGKAVWITALLPFLVLIPLLVRGVLLEGASLGIKYYLKPKWTAILDVDVWVEAAIQIYFALGPGFGTLMALSSYNKFNHNCKRDALIAATLNYFASFISGLVIFAVLGYMANLGRTSIENVVTEGPGLVFQVYPEGLATMRFSAIWSILFFLMVVTLGIDSTFGGLESVITGLCDEYPRVLRAHRGTFIGLLILFIYICSLPTTTHGGNHVIFLLESYGTGVSLLFIVTIETIVVCWIYGAEKFCNNLKEMYGERPGPFWRICWKYISPTILILILFAACRQELAKYHILKNADYTYPGWAPIVGLFMTFSSICCVPIYAIYYLKTKTSGLFLERLKLGVTPKGSDDCSDEKDHSGLHLDTDI